MTYNPEIKLRFFLIILLLSLETFIVKGQNVNFEWAKSIGGSGNGIPPQSDVSNCIKVDAVGNIYTVGYFHDTVDFDPGISTYYMISKGSRDVFITKLDVNGDFVWAKSFGGSGSDVANAISIDKDNNIYLTGYFQDTVDFDPDVSIYNIYCLNFSSFISKLDSSGNFIWAKCLCNNVSINMANTKSIAIDSSDNLYITGEYNGTIDFDPGTLSYYIMAEGGYDIFITKLDSSGSFIWAKSMGGQGDDNSTSIALDKDGNIYTTGGFNGTADFCPGTGVFNLNSANTALSGSGDIFISKLNNSGSFIWAKRIGGTGEEIATSINTDTIGNIYLTGGFDGLVDFNPGVGTYNLMATISDIFVCKLNPLGNLVWAKSMVGTNRACGNSIVLDKTGNIYYTGSFVGTVDFDPSNSNTFLSSQNFQDVFISCLDSAGNLKWATCIGGAYTDIGKSIDIDIMGNVYTTGSFYGTVDFDPGLGIFNLSATTIGFDLFIQKLSQTTTGISEEEINQIKVYPNPANDFLNIKVDNNIVGSNFYISELFGRIIFKGKVSQENIEFPLKGFSPGLYFLSIENKMGYTLKFVKE